MPRPRQVSDEAILEAARECFLEHGAQVSTQIIAERLGVSQAALFKRFGTKQELLLQSMMPPAIPAWIEDVARGPDDRPIPDQLREIATKLSRFMDMMSPRLSVLKSAGCDVASLLHRFEVPPPVRGWNTLAEWLGTAQEQGRVRDGDPRSMALMFLGALQGRVFLAHVVGLPVAIDVDAYIPELIETMWQGFAPRPVEDS